MKKINIRLPDINMKEEEIRFFLAVKLFEEWLVSLGKAAEIAGYSERTFAELLLKKGISSLRFEKIDTD